MISPELIEHNEAFAKERKITFELLSDPDNQIAWEYGLAYRVPDELKDVYLQFDIDLGKYNGDDTWTLPMPARYIIDEDSVIQYAEVNADYTVRPDPEDTIEALKRIVS
jgi:peroxiredoxin